MLPIISECHWCLVEIRQWVKVAIEAPEHDNLIIGALTECPHVEFSRQFIKGINGVPLIINHQVVSLQ